MNGFKSISSQFSSLKKQFAKEEDSEELEQKLKNLLVATCAVVEQNSNASTEKTADDLLNKMVSFAYSNDADIDFLESFTPNLIIKDPTSEGFARMGSARMIAMLSALYPSKLATMQAADYYSIERPHENTSLVARFRKDVPRSVVTDATPAALAAFQARLSAACTRTCYKNRDPILSVFHCDIDSKYGFCEGVHIESGLADIATTMEMDANRELVYVADNQRIKSYQYGAENKELLPKHTLDSKNCGPIAIIDNGSRIMRAGKNNIEFWTVDSLPNHGPEGTTPIGEEVDMENLWTWRDEDSFIEYSTGTQPESTISCTINTRLWTNFPNTSSMLVSPVESYSCFSVDIEAGCKVTRRYLGHGGYVNMFSTSPDDPNNFLTSCNDGVARLFDSRKSLPCLSIDVGTRSEPCRSSLYVHVNGIPIIFTGGLRSEAVKVWDPRASAIMYELATGNNAVISMAWDAPRSTLFAATECSYMDRLGYHHDYRRAKIPKRYDPDQVSSQDLQDQGMNIDNDEDEEEDEDDDYDERYWPKQAHHLETDFGCAFDSGEHRLFRYKFGIDTDPKILPEYGQASPSRY